MESAKTPRIGVLSKAYDLLIIFNCNVYVQTEYVFPKLCFKILDIWDFFIEPVRKTG